MVRLYRQLAPEVRRNLALLFIAALLFWSSMASLLPTLSLYVRSIGGNDSQVGLVMGSFAIGLLLSRSQLGKLADQRGRKVVLLLGAVVATIAPLGYLLVHSVPLLMLLRVFHGLSIAAFTTAYSALVVDLSPIHQRGETIGYMSLTQPIGVAIGPAVGSYLQTTFGHPPAFLAAASFGSIAALSITFIRECRSVDHLAFTTSMSSSPESSPPASIPAAPESPESKPGPELPSSQPGRPAQPMAQGWGRLRDPAFGIPATLMLAIGLVFGTISTFVPLTIVSAQVDLMPGLFYTTAALSSFSMRFFSGRVADRLGRGIFVSISILFYFAAMATMAIAHNVPLFLSAALMEGTGAGLFVPTMIALVSDRTPPAERARTFAVVLTGFDLGIAIAGPVFGSVSDQLGYSTLFTIAAGLALMAGVLFMTRSSTTIGRSFRFAWGRDRDGYALNWHA